MKAAVIAAPKRVEMVELPIPIPGQGEVLVRLSRLGLCGSDLKTYRGLNPLVKYPRIPGHEICGEIVETGRDVPAHLKTGLMVTVLPYTACGHCAACRVGRFNTCAYNQTMGNQREGAAAEYVVARYDKVYPAGHISRDNTILVEPFSVGWHASNRARVSSERTVLVLGCGVVGLGAIAACVHKGARVVAVDIDDSKLKIAVGLGAFIGINSKTNGLEQHLVSATNGESPNIVIEAVGAPSTYLQAIKLVSVAGTVVYVGYSKEPVAYDTQYFVSKELDILGSRNALDQEVREVIAFLSTGTVSLDGIITQRIPLTEMGDVLSLWDQHPERVTKIMVTF